MELVQDPHVIDNQRLLDFEDRKAQAPQAYRLKDGQIIYISYDGNHHVVDADFNIYHIKRIQKPDNVVVLHASHNQRYQYFISIGFLI